MKVNVKKIVIFQAFVLSSFLVYAQNDTIVNDKSKTQQTFKQLVDQIERKTSFNFFYIDSWVDTIKVNTFYNGENVSLILTEALQDTFIKFFVLDNRIILTQNTDILTQFDSVLFGKSNSEHSQKKWNYSFQRENATSESDVTTKKSVIVVGRKTKTVSDQPVSIAGYIKESKSGEPIPGAFVYVESTDKGVVTNQYGFYSLSLAPGAYTLRVKFTGMIPVSQQILLNSDGRVDLVMVEDLVSLKEVIIESDYDVNVSGVQMGMSSIDMRGMKNVPKVLGENDVLKLALTLPGVKTVGEGSAGINVRGGHADQNLMIINEATIYNTSHFLGFFSVFNADAIKSSELYKSAMPVQYGGRLSSTLDLQLKDGNQKKFSGQGGIGPITSHLTLEVPLVKDKTSLMFGGRSTYSDWVLKRIPGSSFKNSSASFYDFFGRITHNMDDKNSFYLSYYYSKDSYKLSSDSLFNYNNALLSLQWRHVFNTKLQGVLSLTNSKYQYSINYNKVPENAFNLGFNIDETNLKLDFAYTKSVNKIDYGLQIKNYNLNPGYISKQSDQVL